MTERNKKGHWAAHVLWFIGWPLWVFVVALTWLVMNIVCVLGSDDSFCSFKFSTCYLFLRELTLGRLEL